MQFLDGVESPLLQSETNWVFGHVPVRPPHSHKSAARDTTQKRIKPQKEKSLLSFWAKISCFDSIRSRFAAWASTKKEKV